MRSVGDVIVVIKLVPCNVRTALYEPLVEQLFGEIFCELTGAYARKVVGVVYAEVYLHNVSSI